MNTFSKKILVMPFLIFSLNCFSENCFKEAPGDEGIAFNTLNAVKLTKIYLSSKNNYGFIATEYIGAPNMQASVYLIKNKEYCFAGDLGAVVDFKKKVNLINNGLYGIEVISKSGVDEFSRQFKYISGSYQIYSCRIKNDASKWRNCKASEK